MPGDGEGAERRLEFVGGNTVEDLEVSCDVFGFACFVSGGGSVCGVCVWAGEWGRMGELLLSQIWSTRLLGSG